MLTRNLRARERATKHTHGHYRRAPHTSLPMPVELALEKPCPKMVTRVPPSRLPSSGDTSQNSGPGGGAGGTAHRARPQAQHRQATRVSTWSGYTCARHHGADGACGGPVRSQGEQKGPHPCLRAQARCLMNLASACHKAAPTHLVRRPRTGTSTRRVAQAQQLLARPWRPLRAQLFKRDGSGQRRRCGHHRGSNKNRAGRGVTPAVSCTLRCACDSFRYHVAASYVWHVCRSVVLAGGGLARDGVGFSGRGRGLTRSAFFGQLTVPGSSLAGGCG